MDAALLIARILLIAVFGVAGITKVADLAGTRKAVREFGVPESLAGVVGTLLPLAELAVAIALIPSDWAWGAAIGALALLLLFIAGIGVSLARGRTPDCHCFGQLYSRPVGAGTLIRNVVLAAVAGFIFVHGIAENTTHNGYTGVAWFHILTNPERVSLGLAALAVAGVIVALWLELQLLAQNGRLLIRMDEVAQGRVDEPVALPATAVAAAAAGLPVGSPAPGFALPGLYGETLTLEALRSAGRPVLLAFTDPGCGPCNALLPDLGRWQRELAPSLAVTVLSRGSVEENRVKSQEHGLSTLLLQQDREILQSYQGSGTPSAVLVQADGTVGSALAQGAEEIRALVARAAAAGAPSLFPLVQANGDGPCPNCGRYHGSNGAAAPAVDLPQGLPVGAPAPAIRLPDLQGTTVELADFRGSDTLVLFWNPDCGFCRRMLDDLKAWEANPQPGAPRLLVVSTGSPMENAEQGLRSTVVLDQGFATGNTFGASGTPSAVLVGANGNVAAPLAIGGPGVMALARGEAAQGMPAAAPAPAAAAVPPPPAPRVGQPATELRLPDLNGSTVDLRDLIATGKGRQTLVLFWNPGCGFCQQMLPALKDWEAKPQAGTPQLLVVSRGSAEENRALGLRSTVVLDQEFAAGSAFGANGTPMAVLIDAEGRIASDVAGGAPAVLALAGAPQR